MFRMITISTMTAVVGYYSRAVRLGSISDTASKGGNLEPWSRVEESMLVDGNLCRRNLRSKGRVWLKRINRLCMIRYLEMVEDEGLYQIGMVIRSQRWGILAKPS